MMVVFSTFVIFSIVQVSTQHTISPRIINGEDAPSDKFSFIASIQLVYLPLLSYYHVCAGTVIDAYWILSTAVCVNRITKIGMPRVKIGMFFTRNDDENVQIIQIAGKIVHENYIGSRNFWTNDIGLIKLKTAISNPKLAKLSQLRNTLEGEAYLTGWGKTSTGHFGKIPTVLQLGRVRTLENEPCQILLNHFGEYFELDDTQICTYSPTSFITGCDGDSGGPVVQNINGKLEIVGLMSLTSYAFEDAGTPSVHTRVSHFLEWINETIAKNSAPADTDMIKPLLTVQQLVQS